MSDMTSHNDQAYPLTVSTGRFPLAPETQEFLCFMSDGRMLASKSHLSHPHVRAFKARVEKLGIRYVVIESELSAITDAYSGAKTKAQGTQEDTSITQDVATALFKKSTTLRASDIHIRVSQKEKTKIFLRVHGLLELIEEHSYEYGIALCTTIYQSMADVSDATFVPTSRQDARIAAGNKLPKGIDGIRIATSPQVGGMIMVMRILYNDATASDNPEDLGFLRVQGTQLELLSKKPYGINIIGGPTGSGKSTTLQRVLVRIIKKANYSLNVLTVEDPPEYPIFGGVQMPVTNAQSEEDRAREFQAAIRSAMRLDPDIIMIGEVRDTPSMQLSVRAAMTGHQVWTTLHANNAFAMINRLVDLGLSIDLVSDASIVTGLICQRLLRVLCDGCKKPLAVAVEDKSIDRDEALRVMKAVKVGWQGEGLPKIHVKGDGCEQCRSKGVNGRTVVAEIVVTTEELMNYVRQHDLVGARKYWRENMGGISMLDHAIHKIREGTVDPFQAEDTIGSLDVVATYQSNSK